MSGYEVKTTEEYESEMRQLIGTLSNEEKKNTIRFLYVCVKELMKDKEP